jgi:hypothetical protein
MNVDDFYSMKSDLFTQSNQNSYGYKIDNLKDDKAIFP